MSLCILTFVKNSNMQKRIFLQRYLLIIRKLRTQKLVSANELFSFLKRESELMEEKFEISKRTFQRDIKDIESIFGIYIKFDRKEKGYFIDEELEEEANTRILESMDLISALKSSEKKSPYILFEPRAEQGSQFMHGLIHAIQNKKCVKVHHKKFWEDDVKTHILKPYAIKEFKNRWYLVCAGLESETIKTFGLDRIYDLEITSDTFKIPNGLNIEEYFKDCFGIINPIEEKPELIELSISADQAGYLKTLPIHHSQNIVFENEEEIRITLFVKVTYDLIKELRSFGKDLTVIDPKSLTEKF
ncbi:MAG: WYL domain-containing protein [Bacteroidetes bacterium]|nr:MAG: WYL domain-containing protein [Bacteroidota bacterium]